MIRLRVLLALVVLMAGTAMPAPSAAQDPGSCTLSKASGRTACRISFHSTPVIISGATTGTGPVSITLTVNLAGNDEAPILQCNAQGTGSARCQADFPDSVTEVDVTPHPLVPVLAFECSIVATGNWTFTCAAGKG